MKKFKSEKKFEEYISHLIKKHISNIRPDIYTLTAKKAVDMVICKDGKYPKLYFLEVKYFNKNKNHAMVFFGDRKGSGFQPEVLTKQPDYFKRNLRWVMGSEGHDGIYFLDMPAVLKHLSGERVGKKQNGFRRSIFDKENGLTETEFISDLKKWLKV